jgi:hypothetical protein
MAMRFAEGLLGELPGVVDVGGEEEREGGALGELGEEVAGGAVGHLDVGAGVLGAEALDDLVEGELEIRGGGDGEGALGLGTRLGGAPEPGHDGSRDDEEGADDERGLDDRIHRTT